MSHCEGSDEAGNLGSHVRLPPFPFSAGTSDTKHTHMLFTQLQPRAPRPGERLRFHRTSLRSLPHPWKAMAMPALPPLQVLLMHRSPPAPRPPTVNGEAQCGCPLACLKSCQQCLVGLASLTWTTELTPRSGSLSPSPPPALLGVG